MYPGNRVFISKLLLLATGMQLFSVSCPVRHHETVVRPSSVATSGGGRGKEKHRQHEPRLEVIVDRANAVRQAAVSLFPTLAEEELSIPSGRADPRIERYIADIIRQIDELEDVTPLEKIMIFHVSLLGQQEYTQGIPVDLLGNRADGRQAGQNDGGIVDMLARTTGQSPGQWCSLLVWTADILFSPGLHRIKPGHPAKHHMADARKAGAWREGNSPYIPRIGDRLIFDTADPDGKPQSGHIATVLHYDEKTDKIWIIEGNTNAGHLGNLAYDTKASALTLAEDRFRRSGGMVGVNCFALRDLLFGIQDHTDPQKIRAGTLKGIVDIRALAKTRGVDLMSERPLPGPHR